MLLALFFCFKLPCQVAYCWLASGVWWMVVWTRTWGLVYLSREIHTVSRWYVSQGMYFWSVKHLKIAHFPLSLFLFLSYAETMAYTRCIFFIFFLVWICTFVLPTFFILVLALVLIIDVVLEMYVFLVNKR